MDALGVRIQGKQTVRDRPRGLVWSGPQNLDRDRVAGDLHGQEQGPNVVVQDHSMENRDEVAERPEKEQGTQKDDLDIEESGQTSRYQGRS